MAFAAVMTVICLMMVLNAWRMAKRLTKRPRRVISNTRLDPGWQSWPWGNDGNEHHHSNPGLQNWPTDDGGGGHHQG
jgi:hypothetical protein